MGNLGRRSGILLVVAVSVTLAVIGLVRPVTNALTGEPNATPTTDVTSSAPPNDTGQNTQTSTTTNDDSTSDDNETDDDSQPSDVDPTSDIEQLFARVDEISAQIDTLGSNVDDTSTIAREAKAAVRTISGEVDTLKGDLVAAVADIGKMKQDLAVAIDQIGNLTELVGRKLVKINNDGNYTGSVAPAQIAPQLRTSDIVGDWPLGRTTDYLDASKVNVDFGGCNSDYRYNTVLSVDPFRRLQCLRLPR